VSCPSGWIIYNNHCYYVNTNPLSWYDANAWCNSYGADLMTIRNDAEYQVLYNFYNIYTPGAYLWVIKLVYFIKLIFIYFLK
jgi:hypothetical protein